jgi:hypothetical protein
MLRRGGGKPESVAQREIVTRFDLHSAAGEAWQVAGDFAFELGLEVLASGIVAVLCSPAYFPNGSGDGNGNGSS